MQRASLSEGVPDHSVLRSGIVRQLLPSADCPDEVRIPTAVIELRPLAGCAGCEQQRKAGVGKGHCGIDLLGLDDRAHRPVITVSLNRRQAKALTIGEAVTLAMPEPDSRWLALAFRVYGFPTLGLIAGAAVGGAVNEAASVVLGAVGCWTGLQIGRRLAHVLPAAAILKDIDWRSIRIVNNQ